MTPSRGFTLLEMTVAIAIFAVIALVAYGSLERFSGEQARLEERLDQLRRLQASMALIERDLGSIVVRPVRDGHGDVSNSLLTGESLPREDELLRFTTRRLDEAGTSGRLQRIAYRLEDRRLFRISWPVLDRDIDTPEYRRLLLDGVESAQLEHHHKEDDQAADTDRQDPQQALDAIEWRLRLADGREYRRLVELIHAP